MARTLEMMVSASYSANMPLVAGVACITFHVDVIWNEFRKRIKIDARGDRERAIECLHLLQETATFLADIAPRCRNVGLLCTTGMRDARVFNDLLEPLGHNVIEVTDEMQRELQETIQHPEWGIKSSAPIVKLVCVHNFHTYAHALIAAGAEVIILGCTEIPFVFGSATTFESAVLVDPLVVLARTLIREVDPLCLKPLSLYGRSRP